MHIIRRPTALILLYTNWQRFSRLTPGAAFGAMRIARHCAHSIKNPHVGLSTPLSANSTICICIFDGEGHNNTPVCTYTRSEGPTGPVCGSTAISLVALLRASEVRAWLQHSRPHHTTTATAAAPLSPDYAYEGAPHTAVGSWSLTSAPRRRGSPTPRRRPPSRRSPPRAAA